MTEKRKVTENDLGLHPQLSERGVNVGDDQEFSIDGFPVFSEASEAGSTADELNGATNATADGNSATTVSDEDGGSAGADASGEGVEREITQGDLEIYPALRTAGATVGQKWSFDTGNGDPIFTVADHANTGNITRAVTADDLANFSELAKKAVLIGTSWEFDKNGDPVFAADPE